MCRNQTPISPSLKGKNQGVKINRKNLPVLFTVVFLVYFLVYWWRLFWGGMIPLNGDSIKFFYPSWVIGKNLLKEGWYFLWDPYRNMGQPFLALPQNQALYPLRFL